MLSPLKERVSNHYGVICWRSVTVPNRVDGEFETIMEDIIKKNYNKYYGGEFKEYLIGGLNINGLEDDQKFFCSELVAYCYQKFGLISSERASNTYLVPDFSSVGYELNPITSLRHISVEESKIKLLNDAKLEGEIELLPHWAEEKYNSETNQIEYYPKISEILEEDLQINNGYGIIKSELMRLTDCNLYIFIEDIVGTELNDFGNPTHGLIEKILNPIDASQLIFRATVGEAPIIPRLPLERGRTELQVGIISSLPFILNCESEPKYSNLKIWITIKEKENFKKADYLGAVCLDPHILPILDQRDNQSTENTQEEILDKIQSKIYLTQQGHLKMKCWIEKL